MSEEQKKSWLVGLRNDFLTGLVLLVPVFITYWVLMAIFNLIDKSVPFIGGKIWGLGFLITVTFIFLVGFLAKNLFGKKIFSYFENLMERLPFIKEIYIASKHLVKSITETGASSFKRVVLVEYPRKGLYTVGFVTRESNSSVYVKGHPQSDFMNVFLPTAPNPTSGYFIMIHKNEVLDAEMSVDDAIKMIMSAGIVNPVGRKIKNETKQEKGGY